MKIKSIIVFLAAVGVFLLAASHRFGDSGHAICMVSKKGGSIRHALHAKKDYGRLTAIVTARVLPPYRGDVKVVLEGEKTVPHDMYLAEPVIDFGIKPWVSFNDNILSGLTPGSNFALWVVMRGIDKQENSDYHLAFYDTKTGNSVLKLPIAFE